MPASIRTVDLGLPPLVNGELRWRADKAAPYETGGVITADGRVLEFDNLSPYDKRHHYECDLEVDEAYAFWHTHPNGQSFLSGQDIITMGDMRKAGIFLPWVVVGPNTITSWEHCDIAASVTI